MTINQQKHELRKKFLEQRRALAANDAAARSASLSNQLIEKIDWGNTKNLHVFLPITSDNEPDLREFIKYALYKADIYASYPPGKKVAELQSPIAVKQYDVSQNQILFDVIVVPMLAYDPETNHRLGYGGGFYDRIIASQPRAKTIGVVYSDFVASLPFDSHDKTLDVIFTA